MPRKSKSTRRRRTRKTAGYRFGQPDEHPAETLYPGSGTQLDARPVRRGKRTLKKGGKLRRKL